MDTGAVPAGPPPRPPWIVWLGLGIVLAAAAVLSFDALRALAVAVGIAGHLAWLLPIAVDAGAAASCAVWLGGRSTVGAARYAGRMTWALLAVTVAGNAGQLGMHAHGITPPWWVAVLVGAIPPAVVGSTVHLVVLLVRRSAPGRIRHARAESETAVEMLDVEPAAIEAGDDELLPAVRDWIARHETTPSQRQLRAEFQVGAERARKLMEAVA